MLLRRGPCSIPRSPSKTQVSGSMDRCSGMLARSHELARRCRCRSTNASRSRSARFHYNVDKYGELPILGAVVVTGAILTVRAWPLTSLHFVKIGLSLIAVTLAVICTRNRGRKHSARVPSADLDSRRRSNRVCDARTLSGIGVFRPLIGYFMLATFGRR
jgi:hypothetical protein